MVVMIGLEWMEIKMNGLLLIMELQKVQLILFVLKMENFLAPLKREQQDKNAKMI